jgi:hypothetical protein
MRVRTFVASSLLVAACVLTSASSVGATGLTPQKHARALAVTNLTLPAARLREGTPNGKALFALQARTGYPIRDAMAPRGSHALRAPAAYQTQDGMTVYVWLSDYYVPDPNADLSYVNFLGWLTHGAELSGLNVYILSPDEMKAVCGATAAACYSPPGTMVVSGENTGGIPIEQAVAHEYGHHIASHRLNPPWRAVDWGPKRWASAMDICANVSAGKLFPGAEPPDTRYPLNPGEGWAEAYRRVNELRAGSWTPFGWVVVDPFFIPDGATEALVARDVMNPWSGPTVHVKRGRMRARGIRRWTLYPYDGPMTASISGSPGNTVSLRIGGRVVRGPARRVSRVVCGSEPVTVVARSARGGIFSLRVSDDEG